MLFLPHLCIAPLLLQQSFGFITCCERNESIFFHFSQYSGDAGELRPGGECKTDPHPHTVMHLYKARHPLVALPFAWSGYISVPEKALGWFPLGFVEDQLFMCKFHLPYSCL